MKPDIADWTDKAFAAENGMLPYAADWLQNKCFDKGAQWLARGDGAIVSLVPATDDIKRITVNVYQDQKRTLVSKLTAQQPIPVVTPATSSADDRNVARECEHLLKYFWRTHYLSEELDYLASDIVDCGGGWWQISWDAEAGEDVEYVAPGSALDLNGEPEVKTRKSGDIRVHFVSALEMRVDPSALRMRDVRWLARVHYMSTGEIRDRWNEDVPADAAGTRPSILSPDWLLNPQRLFAKDIARVVEVWHQPTDEYPKGFYLAFTSSHELEYVGECAELPFLYCPFDPDQDNFYGKTPMTYARRPQIELNAALSMISDGRSRGAFPAWLQQRGANMDIPTGRPHEVLGYNDNHNTPQRVPGDPVADALFRISDTFYNLMGSTSGIQQTDNSTSGKDRLYAAEQDNTKLGPALRALHGFLKRAAMRMLNLWRDNATVDLTYAVGDPNAGSDVRSFSAQKIRYRDVEMSIDSALPLNRQARRDQILMWYQAGLIDQKRAMQLSEFGETDDALGTSNLDRERARNENQALEVQPVGVEEFEDHAAHLEEHLSAMKQDKWYLLPEPTKDNFRQHIAIHRQYLQMAMGIVSPGGQPLTNGADSGNNASVGSMADVPAASNSMIPMQAPVSDRDNQGLGVINGRTPLPQQGAEG